MATSGVAKEEEQGAVDRGEPHAGGVPWQAQPWAALPAPSVGTVATVIYAVSQHWSVQIPAVTRYDGSGAALAVSGAGPAGPGPGSILTSSGRPTSSGWRQFLTSASMSLTFRTIRAWRGVALEPKCW